MLNRHSLFLIAMIGAAVIPYGLAQRNGGKSPGDMWNAMWSDASADDPALADPWPVPSGSPTAGWQPSLVGRENVGAGAPAPSQGGPPQLAGPQVQSLGELFRFDITSAWIMNHWLRVSTGLVDDGLEGFRVTAVSGTGHHDIAGSLTYYFDRQYQTQRIRFRGSTPDPSQLVAFMVQHYGLRPEPALGAGLFLTREGETIRHGMRIQHAAVVRADRPHQRYSVELELNRPGSRYALSTSFTSILEAERRSRRWSPPTTDAAATPQGLDGSAAGTAPLRPTQPDDATFDERQ